MIGPQFPSLTLKIVEHSHYLPGGKPAYLGRLGAELTVEDGRKAAAIACLDVLSAARHHVGSLDKVSRVVRLGVSIATDGDFREHPNVADAASEMLVHVFGEEKLSTRIVLGVASVPLGMPIELEVIFARHSVNAKESSRAWQSENSYPSRLRCAFSCPAGSRLGSGSRQSKGESHEYPRVLSHRAGRWPVHFLPGGRAQRRPCPAFASRPAILFADV